MSVRDRYERAEFRGNGPQSPDERWRLRIQQEIATDVLMRAIEAPSTPFAQEVLFQFQQHYRSGQLDDEDMRLRAHDRDEWRKLARGLLAIARGPAICPPSMQSPLVRPRGALYG